jgi:hypothetical protein
MPAKSKRNKRNLPLSRKIDTPVITSVNNNAPNPDRFAIRSNPLSDQGLSIYGKSSYKNIITEMKWIAVTTGIIIVLMVISYFVFR